MINKDKFYALSTKYMIGFDVLKCASLHLHSHDRCSRSEGEVSTSTA